MSYEAIRYKDVIHNREDHRVEDYPRLIYYRRC